VQFQPVQVVVLAVMAEIVIEQFVVVQVVQLAEVELLIVVLVETSEEAIPVSCHKQQNNKLITAIKKHKLFVFS
ncbi:MAG: hypothetical protein N3A59_09145, partial [Thermodesulfovibrionales bacterium]|nr:hypothetical protein [Thermodesulfovibrionales bacterium]